MSAFFKSPPIFVLQNSFEKQFEVAVCLHEPLNAELKPEVNSFRHLLSLLSQLSILLVKESISPSQNSPSAFQLATPITTNTNNLKKIAPYTPVSDLKTHLHPPSPFQKVNLLNEHQPSPSSKPKLSDEIVTEIFKTIAQISPHTNAQQYLVSSGLIENFPDLAQKLGCEEVIKPSGSFDEYLSQMTALHQIVALCTQLSYDINLHNHKYIAHQIALLYQSVNSIVGQQNKALEPYKKLIEEGFEDVKASTEGQKTPLLNNNQQNWLVHLTSGILNTVSSLSVDVSQKIQPFLDFIEE